MRSIFCGRNIRTMASLWYVASPTKVTGRGASARDCVRLSNTVLHQLRMKRIKKIDQQRAVGKAKLGCVHVHDGNIRAGLRASVAGDVLLSNLA